MGRHSEWSDGLKQGLVIGVLFLAAFRPSAQSPVGAGPSTQPGSPSALSTAAEHPQRRLALRGADASPDVRRLAGWVVHSADNGDRPFAVLDKKQAQLYVFDTSGGLIGTSPVLLGYAKGDHTVQGIGDKPIADVQPDERTTPAGRFEAATGRNTLGDDVVWVDYAAAVSMHKVRLTDPAERRLERLTSATASDNRISYGCINLPPAFFELVLWPSFQNGAGVVYVLPEVRALGEVFPELGAQEAREASSPRPSRVWRS